MTGSRFSSSDNRACCYKWWVAFRLFSKHTEIINNHVAFPLDELKQIGALCVSIKFGRYLHGKLVIACADA